VKTAAPRSLAPTRQRRPYRLRWEARRPDPYGAAAGPPGAGTAWNGHITDDYADLNRRMRHFLHPEPHLEEVADWTAFAKFASKELGRRIQALEHSPGLKPLRGRLIAANTSVHSVVAPAYRAFLDHARLPDNGWLREAFLCYQLAPHDRDRVQLVERANLLLACLEHHEEPDFAERVGLRPVAPGTPGALFPWCVPTYAPGTVSHLLRRGGTGEPARRRNQAF
jgi:hypothetical protein